MNMQRFTDSRKKGMFDFSFLSQKSLAKRDDVENTSCQSCSCFGPAPPKKEDLELSHCVAIQQTAKKLKKWNQVVENLTQWEIILLECLNGQQAQVKCEIMKPVMHTQMETSLIFLKRRGSQAK
jgi:hypothetical protein